VPKRARRSETEVIAGQSGFVYLGRWRRARESPESSRPDDDTYLQRGIDVRHILNGEWVWDVLVTLRRGPAQYTSLLEAIQSRSTDGGWPGRQHRHLRDGTLNRTLRRMEQSERVEGTREQEFPYRATYQLTSAAQELLAATAGLVDWAEQHSDLLDRVRERRRAETSDRPERGH
jgi:DNA-binding HxlR family transcriptional regulator